jgi:hypothetical protein
MLIGKVLLMKKIYTYISDRGTTIVYTRSVHFTPRHRGSEGPAEGKISTAESELFLRPIGLSVIAAWAFANSGAANTIISNVVGDSC